MAFLHTLRLNFQGGVWNEYRVRDSRLEFRIGPGKWRVMDESDVLMHFRFNTEVARWLRKDILEQNPFAPADSFQSKLREL